jgi:hypothetical protein
MNARRLIERLAEAERGFLEAPFLAPVVGGRKVRVRVEGIAWEMAVAPSTFEGWAILRADSAGLARVVSTPGLGPIRANLSALPRISVVLCERAAGGWRGIAASDRRIQVRGCVPVWLTGEARLFDRVWARWDGAGFLFEGRDARRDPTLAAYLREAVEEKRSPEALDRPGLAPEEREAYAWQYRLIEQQLRDATEERLREAVAHAGGRFHGYVEREGGYTVTYVVDGVTHTSTVRKGDLTLMTAGICLSGEDEKFDLQSLVSVIREGRSSGSLEWDEYELPLETRREGRVRGRRR